MKEINKYYSKRAKEYEKIYYRTDPLRQDEQNKISKKIKELFEDKKVLEVACGTGYWTTYLSETAKEITAIDNSTEVIKIAKKKKYRCPVYFKKCDAYHLPFKINSFEGSLVNFWFSHIPKEKIKPFLDNLHSVLLNNSVVFIADNVFNENIGGKLVKDSRSNNTYKIRVLEDGEQYKVLKNYYSEQEIKKIFNSDMVILDIYFGSCFWYVCYEVKKITNDYT